MPSQESLDYLRKTQEYCNLPEWWAHEWKGGGNHWDMESYSNHGEGTRNSDIYAAPFAKVINAPVSGIFPNFVVPFEGKKYEVEEFIVEKNIKFATCSIGGTAEHGLTDLAKYWLNIRNKYNLILNNSAGNEGTKYGLESNTAQLPAAAAIYWCACGLVRGNPSRDDYSSVDSQNDFTMFTSFLEGTSFSSPTGAGMEDVICSRYGYDKSHDWMYSYLKMISKDMQAAGFDPYTGWGIPILPKASRRLIEMAVGSKDYSADSIHKVMDTAPMTKTITDQYGNRNLVVFVPVRVIGETFGKTVNGTVNPDKSVKVTIADKSKVVVLNTGSTNMEIYTPSGQLIVEQEMPLAPFIDSFNRTQVPLRAVSQAFGSKVEWVQSEKLVMILE